MFCHTLWVHEVKYTPASIIQYKLILIIIFVQSLTDARSVHSITCRFQVWHPNKATMLRPSTQHLTQCQVEKKVFWSSVKWKQMWKHKSSNFHSQIVSTHAVHKLRVTVEKSNHAVPRSTDSSLVLCFRSSWQVNCHLRELQCLTESVQSIGYMHSTIETLPDGWPYLARGICFLNCNRERTKQDHYYQQNGSLM